MGHHFIKPGDTEDISVSKICALFKGYHNISNNKLMYLIQGADWVANGMSCGDIQWNAPAILCVIHVEVCEVRHTEYKVLI
jgi:hypothetical protein